MTPEFVIEFAKQAIILTIYLSMPMLGLEIGRASCRERVCHRV